MCTFSRAIVREPGANFALGLTTSRLGTPDLEKAREQHRSYCDALRACGLEVAALAASDDHPDATFLEDVAVIAEGRVMLTRPGAAARRAEVDLIRSDLGSKFNAPSEIAAPGTLDGGDVCEAGDRWFIGISHRTNESGAEQLARWLAQGGRTAMTVDIRPIDGALHLKTAIAYLGDGILIAWDALRDHRAWHHLRVVAVDETEAYAANCVRLNDRVLVADGFPRTAAALNALGLEVLPLAMSEFEKMDGGLSCLSLRY